MSATELVRLLDVLDELGPEPFLRCGCLACLEVVETSIDADRYDNKESLS